MYSINDKRSFEGAKSLLQRILRVRDCLLDDVTIVVCGNKKDLEDQREVSTETGQELADSINSSFFEISAKEGFNVVEVFETIIREVEGKRALKREREAPQARPRGLSLSLRTKSLQSLDDGDKAAGKKARKGRCALV